MRSASWIAYLLLLGAAVIAIMGLQEKNKELALLKARDVTMPPDSAIVWISTPRLNNIRQAARDMEIFPDVMEAMYEEMIYQERRADSLEALIRRAP